jgi:hypothetical protein
MADIHKTFFVSLPVRRRDFFGHKEMKGKL